MAITSPDGIIAGAQPMNFFYKALSGTLVAGRPFSPFYTNGIPGPAVAPASGVNGAALTSYPGQLPFTNPGAGNSYVGRLSGSAAIAGTLLLCDRLWHNSGLSVTSLTSQAISMPTLPARDRDGTTNGKSVLIGMEVVTATGAGLNVPTLTYTDQDGNTGATATPVFAYAASSAVGSFYPFGLAAGDTGVRAVSAFQNSVSMTSGSISLVAFRVLSQLDAAGFTADAIDAITGGFSRAYDNTVPFLLFIPSTTTSSNIQTGLTWTQG